MWPERPESFLYGPRTKKVAHPYPEHACMTYGPQPLNFFHNQLDCLIETNFEQDKNIAVLAFGDSKMFFWARHKIWVVHPCPIVSRIFWMASQLKCYLVEQLSTWQSLVVRLKKGVPVISGEIVVVEKNSAILAAAIEPVIGLWN